MSLVYHFLEHGVDAKSVHYSYAPTRLFDWHYKCSLKSTMYKFNVPCEFSKVQIKYRRGAENNGHENAGHETSSEAANV